MIARRCTGGRFRGVVASILVSAVACGPTTEDGDRDDDRCADASISMGLIGRTQERICDVGGPEECLRAAPGITVGLYDRYAQVGGEDFGGGTLDPEAVELASVVSGGGGSFAIERASLFSSRA